MRPLATSLRRSKRRLAYPAAIDDPPAYASVTGTTRGPAAFRRSLYYRVPSRMRRASLGTIFLTVFLDLLGFGLVIPFLPGFARQLGASDLVATLTGAIYSLMQF